MDWFMGKRRKDKDVTSSPGGSGSPTGVNAEVDSRPYLDDDFTQERIIDVDLLPLVLPPYGVDYNEWLATHTLAFFEHINFVYGCLSEFCQFPTCPAMTGPGSTQYQWIDERGKKCKCTAPQYVDYVMTYSQKCISDEAVFPTKYGNPFPSSFEATVKKIHRLLVHVLAHVYQCHCRHLASLRLHGHVNTLTYHFMLFSKQFTLVDDKELDVLDDLYNRLRHHHSTVRRPACVDHAPPDDTAPATAASVATATDAMATASPTTVAIDDLLQPTTPDAVLARILADDSGSSRENIVMTAAVNI